MICQTYIAPYAVRWSGNLQEEDAEDCESFLTEAIASDDVKPWFSNVVRVLNERPFIIMDKDGSKRYRPDRVVWTESGTIDIIDFKFGEEEPKKYFYQVRRYMKHLSSMFPGIPVNGYLWYPLESKIIRV